LVCAKHVAQSNSRSVNSFPGSASCAAPKKAADCIVWRLFSFGAAKEIGHKWPIRSAGAGHGPRIPCCTGFFYVVPRRRSARLGAPAFLIACSIACSQSLHSKVLRQWPDLPESYSMFQSPKTARSTRRSWRDYVESVAVLIGHIVVTALIFLSLIVAGWSVSFAVHTLNKSHPFPAAILAFITKFELFVFYGDSVLCAFILVGGAIKFLAEEWEGLA
jgi:hypothetical protein